MEFVLNENPQAELKGWPVAKVFVRPVQRPVLPLDCSAGTETCSDLTNHSMCAHTKKAAPFSSQPKKNIVISLAS